MSQVTVAATQMSCSHSYEENIREAERLVRELAREKGLPDDDDWDEDDVDADVEAEASSAAAVPQPASIATILASRAVDSPCAKRA